MLYNTTLDQSVTVQSWTSNINDNNNNKNNNDRDWLQTKWKSSLEFIFRHLGIQDNNH